MSFPVGLSCWLGWTIGGGVDSRLGSKWQMPERSYDPGTIIDEAAIWFRKASGQTGCKQAVKTWGVKGVM